MGKSTAANMLRQMGIPVHCSDDAVHALYRAGGAAVEPVALTFPGTYDKKKHCIKRDKLAEIIWEDEDEKEKLESIIHPLVVKAQQKFLKRLHYRRVKLAVLDIPLLFETGADRRVDYVACVSAPFLIQSQRLMQRPGMTPDRIYQILMHQMPDAEKRRRSDFIVHTGLNRAHTYRQLKEIVKILTENKVEEHDEDHRFPT